MGKLLKKLITFLIMVALLGTGVRFARPYLMKSAGLPDLTPGTASSGPAHFSSGESDLMKTVFTDAIRLLTGSASRQELAADLSQKLYAGRADAATMNELGIELVQPGATPNNSLAGHPAAGGASPATAAAANPAAGATFAAGLPGAAGPDAAPEANPPTGRGPVTGSLQVPGSGNVPRIDHALTTKGLSPILTALWQKSVANPELALMPMVCVGMFGFRRLRRRKPSLGDDLSLLPDMSKLLPSDSEPYTMTHAVHDLKAEDFELLVALVYQRQGYRVSMPAGLSGGRGGNFLLTKKNERLLVQCKNTRQDFKVPIERIRELHEAVSAAGATGGLYVASCGYTWDARNFGKANNVTAINARTLDQLVTAAAQNESDGSLLAVAKWAPAFLAKVKLTPPTCPTCEAEMDQLRVSAGTVWVCQDRPECKGRRIGRNYLPGSARSNAPAEALTGPRAIAAAAAPILAKGAKPKKALPAVTVEAEALPATSVRERVATALPAAAPSASPISATLVPAAVEPLAADAPTGESIIPYVTRRIMATLLRAKPRPGLSTLSARPTAFDILDL